MKILMLCRAVICVCSTNSLCWAHLFIFWFQLFSSLSLPVPRGLWKHLGKSFGSGFVLSFHNSFLFVDTDPVPGIKLRFCLGGMLLHLSNLWVDLVSLASLCCLLLFIWDMSVFSHYHSPTLIPSFASFIHSCFLSRFTGVPFWHPPQIISSHLASNAHYAHWLRDQTQPKGQGVRSLEQVASLGICAIPNPPCGF